MRLHKKIRLFSLACSAGLFSLASSARGVLTYGGYNPVSTDPAPGNVDTYEGQFFGGFAGTPITSNIMMTATHVTPGPTTTFVFNNGTSTATTYNIQQVATLDDLALWEIAPNQTGSFSHTAPIYTGSSEVGSTIVAVGRGYSAGGANFQPGTTTQDGWVWGGGQGPFSWGNNTVSAIATGAQFGLSGPQGGPYLEFDFKNLPSNPNEAIITPFDSGGGAFINVGGTYELAGVNTFVTQVADSGGTAVSSALWDTFGYYDNNSMGQLQQITTHNLPESSYATRVSTKQNLVGVVTGTITPAQAASFPILDDSQLAIYSTLTTGAITATPGATLGGQLIIGDSTFGATLHIAKNSGASRFSDLTIAANSQLDINNNHAIINYTAGSDPIASIAAWIKSGYANGAWNGAGIMSTAAQTNSGSYGIGYADAADPGNPAGLSSGQIEIKYTLLGDANLDGSVNGSDFAILASNFNKAVSGWDAGDFNYDGSVNGADFAFLAANFNKGASQSSVADLQALDSFAAANDLNNVPEPIALSLLIPASAFLFRRRRPR